MSKAVDSEFKGHPTLELWEDTDQDRPTLSFGVRKARLILEHLEAIRAMVDKADGIRRPVNGGGNGSNGAKPAMRPDPIVWGRDIDPAPIAIQRKPLPRVEPESPSEEALREEKHCRGCNADKARQGLIVCWGCFKRHPVAPLKDSGLSPAQWIKRFGQFDGQGGAR